MCVCVCVCLSVCIVNCKQDEDEMTLKEGFSRVCISERIMDKRDVMY